MTSGSVGQCCCISCSMADFEWVYSTRCSARCRNSALSATSESGSGEQDIAVPTWRKRCRPATCAIRCARRSVPVTLTFQMSGLLPNEATAAQLRTWVTCSSRGSLRKCSGEARSPSRICCGRSIASFSSAMLNLRMFSLTRSRPASGLLARTSSSRSNWLS